MNDKWRDKVRRKVRLLDSEARAEERRLRKLEIVVKKYAEDPDVKVLLVKCDSERAHIPVTEHNDHYLALPDSIYADYVSSGFDCHGYARFYSSCSDSGWSWERKKVSLRRVVEDLCIETPKEVEQNILSHIERLSGD